MQRVRWEPKRPRKTRQDDFGPCYGDVVESTENTLLVVDDRDCCEKLIRKDHVVRVWTARHKNTGKQPVHSWGNGF